MVAVAPRRPRIEFRPDDPTLTANGGLVLVAETCRVLDVGGHHRPPRRSGQGPPPGAGAGELLVGLAECMLAGGTSSSTWTTALGLARRFGPEQTAGLRAAQAELVDRHVAALPPQRRRALLAVRPTIDLDPTDVEVYGTAKERIGWTYAGVRAGRPVPLVWAEAGLVLTGTLWPVTRTSARTPRR